MAAALNVVEPFMSGLGGGGWMHVYHAKSGEHKVLDYCGQCPAGADLASGRAWLLDRWVEEEGLEAKTSKYYGGFHEDNNPTRIKNEP